MKIVAFILSVICLLSCNYRQNSHQEPYGFMVTKAILENYESKYNQPPWLHFEVSIVNRSDSTLVVLGGIDNLFLFDENNQPLDTITFSEFDIIIRPHSILNISLVDIVTPIPTHGDIEELLRANLFYIQGYDVAYQDSVVNKLLLEGEIHNSERIKVVKKFITHKSNSFEYRIK